MSVFRENSVYKINVQTLSVIIAEGISAKANPKEKDGPRID